MGFSKNEYSEGVKIGSYMVLLRILGKFYFLIKSFEYW